MVCETGSKNWRIKSAIEAYKNGEKTEVIRLKFHVGMIQLYRWIDRLGVQRRGRYKDYKKLEPDPNVKAALNAYQKSGARIRDICVRFHVNHDTIHFWVKRLNIPRRRQVLRSGKAGQPKKKPLVYECDWCGDPLSEYQIKRRRKYCCNSCRVDGTEDLKRRASKPCAAPGCEAMVPEPDMTYCGWECFSTAMKAKFD